MLSDQVRLTAPRQPVNSICHRADHLPGQPLTAYLTWAKGSLFFEHCAKDVSDHAKWLMPVSPAD